MATISPEAVSLALEQVTFGYKPNQPIVRDFTWRIERGESWSILGPSGSGKSTLLYLLAGLRQPEAGRVCFRDRPLNGPNRDVGLVLQDYGLLPWFTAHDNIQLGLKIRGVPPGQARQIASEWLERLHIEHVGDQYPSQLSGGQRQRVALARALALQTRVVLLDEPFSSVDELTRERLQQLMWELKHELGLTTVLVTHSVEEAVILGNNLLIITEHAPITRGEVLRSPFNGERPNRGDPRFAAFCAEVRNALELP